MAEVVGDDGHGARSAFGPTDVALFVTLASVWGFSFLFIKVAVHTIAPLWVVVARTAVGAAVLLVILRGRGQRLPRQRAVWWHLVVLAAIGNVVPWWLVAWAEQAIPSGIAAVVNSLVPAMTLAVAGAVGVEQITVRKAVGLGVALFGTAVVVSGELGQPGRAVALFAVVLATVLFAASGVYTKRFVSGRQPALAVAAGQVLAAAALSLPAARLLAPTPEWPALDLAVWGSLAALGVFGTGLAFYLFFTLVERIGPTYTSMVTYVIPVIGLAAGWLVLGERLGWHVLAGAGVIVAGIWLAQRERRAAVMPEDEPQRVAV